jgi:RNA polymerase sigma factor (sigma-70 family)
MTDDRQLLDRYAAENSDEAFRLLVQRHMGLVYSAALRQVRDPQLAQDVTQIVFANLARKARSIPAETVLAGWLHRDTRFTALDLLRAETRRAKREQQAVAMNALDSVTPQDWEPIRPLLDEALDELGPADRDALLLRYFEQRDFAGVGEALGASADAARKRVDRALDRLREFLARRGITTTTAALSTTLSVHAIETVPAAFASSLAVTSAAAAAIAATAGTTNWMANLLLMTKTKLTLGSVLVAAALAVPLLHQQQALATARAEQDRLQAQLRNTTPPAAAVDPNADTTATEVSAQRDRADLERLRRETAALRAHISELAAEEKNLAATPPQNPANAVRGEVIGINSARNVGQNSPADLVQTFVWALSNGDTNLVMQLVVSDSELDAQKLVQPAFVHLKQAMLDTVTSFGCTGFNVQGDQPAENNDRWLVVDLMTPNGNVGQPTMFRIRPTNTGWRMVVMPNGTPVNQELSK